MKGTTEVTMETLLISALNIGAVYVAAFVYKLNWAGVTTVMIMASLLTATVTHFIITKIIATKDKTDTTISEGLSVLGVALLSSIAVLIILTQRFNFAQALGISLLSGMLSSFLRHMMS